MNDLFFPKKSYKVKKKKFLLAFLFHSILGYSCCNKCIQKPSGLDRTVREGWVVQGLDGAIQDPKCLPS